MIPLHVSAYIILTYRDFVAKKKLKLDKITDLDQFLHVFV